MHSALILDFSGRYIFALMVDKNGYAVPCCHKVEGRTFRYFSGGLFLTSDQYGTNVSDDLAEAMNRVVAENRGNPFFSARDIGWVRPWEISSETDAEPVINPLRVLSFYSSGEESLLIAGIAGAMLMFILQPLAVQVRKHIEISERVPVIIIIPDYLSRQARALFCRVIRNILPNAAVRMICHAAALSMNLINSGRSVNIHALHSDNDGLHCSLIRMNRPEENACKMEVIGLSSVQELGWSGLIKKYLSKNKGADNALFSLVTGVPSARISHDLDKTVSHMVENGFFQYELKPFIQQCIADHFSTMEPDDCHQLLFSGVLSMIRGGDKIISESMKNRIPSDVEGIPGIERPAYGVVKMLKWLGQGKNRSVTIDKHNGFRVATAFDQESMPVLHPSFLKLHPGENRKIIKILALKTGKIFEQAEIVVLWGTHPMPAGNACVGVLPLEVVKNISDHDNRITLEFDLRGTLAGLRGNVTARVGKYQTLPVKLEIPRNTTVLEEHL